MPRRAPLEDDAKNFTAELDAIEDTGSGSDESDVGTATRILMAPQPDAPMHEVCKALKIAQQLYNTVRSELQALKKDYAALQAAVPACSHNKVLKKTSALDSQITRAGKKYAMFHYFQAMNGLFPTTPQPNVSPRSDTRWASPEAKLNGAMAELYHCVPKSLCTQVITQSDGNLLTVRTPGLIFSSLKLDPTVFTARPAEKQENELLLALLKKHGEDEYTRLAPILFTNPSAMVPNDFLKTPIMVKIIHVEIFRKASLSGKTKGYPKARGQHWDMQCVMEGLIAGAAIVARFLLTHDQELTATGSATKIEYGQDYDFYLERLFKHSSWAISVIDYYNREVFGTSSVSASLSAPLSTSQPRTWEDDFLQQLEAPAPAPPAPTPAPPAPAPAPPAPAPAPPAPAPAPAPTASTLSAHSIDEDVVPIVPLAPPPAVKQRAARGRPKRSEK
ncbi:hypothetical protein BD769DRAFT_1389131 [Suillus cothurnatus]|nr:hypothetical protein BD769DRAFT_1389131 [Suillus cothurnatus]